MLDAAEDASISLDLSANLSSGKFKVLLVSEDNDITTLLEGDDTQNTSVDLDNGIMPDILAFYESAEGQREFAEWKKQREAERQKAETKK